MNFAPLQIIGPGISGMQLSTTPSHIITHALVLASLYGPRSSTEAALDLFAQGAVRGIFNTEPLAKVNEVIDRLRSYEITGRTVLIPENHQ